MFGEPGFPLFKSSMCFKVQSKHKKSIMKLKQAALKTSNYKYLKHQLSFVIFMLLACMSPEVIAQGSLLITPNRVVFEGRKQKEQLNLINSGDETATYTVSFVQRNMNEDGSFEIIYSPDSGQMFADPYLRIYPRRVTLLPGEAQVVLLQCRRQSDMIDGEYRSHLYFRSEKNIAPLGSEKPSQDSAALSIQVIPIFGMSIPIIIRSGSVSVETSISDLKLQTNDGTYLTFIIHRKGNISVYGNLVAEYIPKNGKPYQVGGMNGVAVYTNIDKRYVSIKLDPRDGMELTDGILRLSYVSRDETKTQEVYAVAELELK